MPTGSSIDSSEIIEIKFEALIDGKDELILQDNKIWYNHLVAQKPGLFNDENVSTRINDYEWYPSFPFQNHDPQVSEPLVDIITIPSLELTYTLTNINIIDFNINLDPVVERTEDLIYISQQPLESNNFTLIITLNDEHPIGAAWYSFTQTTNQEENPEPDASIIEFLVYIVIGAVSIVVLTKFLPKTRSNDKFPEEEDYTRPPDEVKKTPKPSITPSPNYCGGCGSVLDDVDLFCGRCGTKT